jgi:hypothetical protein
MFNKKKNLDGSIKKLTYQKIKYHLWTYFVLKILKDTSVYFYLYKSFWQSVLNFNLNFNNINKNQKNYMSIEVNPGGGVGHQLANYNSAIWYAKKFNLIHAHTSFPNKKWEKLLGFNYSTICLENLINKGYKKIKLPLFKEKDLIEISKIKKIIHSYKNKKIIFFLEFDQPYTKQYQIAEILKEKFFSAKQRSKDKLIYNEKNFNIAVHIRVGDIMNNEKLMNERFLDVNYFIKVINKSLSIIKTPKKKIIHIFSANKLDSLSKLANFENIKFCHNLNHYKTFLHFVYADLLITSKSSFSYKAALINRGIKLCPKQFWHKYPKNNKNWVLIDV